MFLRAHLPPGYSGVERRAGFGGKVTQVQGGRGGCPLFQKASWDWVVRDLCHSSMNLLEAATSTPLLFAHTHVHVCTCMSLSTQVLASGSKWTSPWQAREQTLYLLVLKGSPLVPLSPPPSLGLQQRRGADISHLQQPVPISTQKSPAQTLSQETKYWCAHKPHFPRRRITVTIYSVLVATCFHGIKQMCH